MKAALIVAFVALIAGGAIGTVLGQRDFGGIESHFGPFRAGESISLDEVDKMLAEREAAGVPKLEILGENPYDFGVMRRNAKAKHSFVIKNAGTAPLELSVTGSTCKCTVGTLKAELLEPGETTEVELEWEAKTGGSSFGQSANLKTNDPVQGEVSLGVNGKVIDLVAAEPSAWNLGDVAGTESIELKTTLFNHAESPIVLTKVQWLDEVFANASDIKTERREVSEEEAGIHKGASEAFDVTVKVAGPLAQGSLNKRFRVEYRNKGDSDDDVHPPIELVLTGRIVGELSILGGAKLKGTETGDYQLTLGRTDVGQVLKEKIYVVLRGAKRDTAQLRIGSIDPEVALEAEFGEPSSRGEMKVFPLTISTKADAPEMVRGGQVDADPAKISIESDDPEVAPIVIDVLFRIGDGFSG